MPAPATGRLACLLPILCLAILLAAACGAEPEPGGDVAEQIRTAAGSFCDGPVEVGDHSEPESIEVEAESFTSKRVLDTIFALAAIASLIGIGYLIRSAEPGFKPLVFAGIVLAILVLTVVNPSHWEYAGARVDGDGILVRRHAARDVSIEWADVTAVRLDDGDLFPFFADDRELVFVGSSGESASLPRFSPRALEIAAFAVRRLAAPSNHLATRTPGAREGAGMSNDLSEKAAALIAEAERMMGELVAKLEDDSLPAMERMAAAASVGAEIEKCMSGVVAEGIGRDHPAVAGLAAKAGQIGQMLEAIAAQGAAEVAEATASPPPPSDSEKLGRSAAELEVELLRAIVDGLADRPEEAAAVERLRGIRNEFVRKMYEIGRKRADLDDKGKRDYQWGWASATRELKESASGPQAAYGQIQRDYVASSGMNQLFMDLMGLNRFAELEKLSPASEKTLEEAGLK